MRHWHSATGRCMGEKGGRIDEKASADAKCFRGVLWIKTDGVQEAFAVKDPEV